MAGWYLQSLKTAPTSASTTPNITSFEIDAIPVQLLQQKLREAIEQYLDMDEFNAQLKLEQQDAVEI